MEERLQPHSKVQACSGGYPGVIKIITCSGYGTGFLGKINLNGKDSRCGLFTNNHVVSQRDEFTVEFHLHRKVATDPDKPESGTEPVTVQVSKDEIRYFFTCPLLDATFIEFKKPLVDEVKTKPKASGLELEYFPLMQEPEFQELCQNDRVSDIKIKVPGYPGDTKESVDCDGTKKFAEGRLHSIRGFNLLHLASTTRGSSGSPLFIQNKVVGLHKTGSDKYNVATAVFAIIEAMKRAKMQNIQPSAECIGLTLRFPNERGGIDIYSYISESSKVWVIHTKHGLYYTLRNPATLPKEELNSF